MDLSPVADKSRTKFKAIEYWVSHLYDRDLPQRAVHVALTANLRVCAMKNERTGEPPQASSAKTDFSLFIIESLEFADERRERLEGKILRNLLRLSRQGIDTEYLYIRTWQEFKEALKIFYRSNKRYLHISCHGNEKEVALTLDVVSVNKFGNELVPYVRNRRLFFSACEVANEELANAVMKG
jgi:hypothetical protein